MEKDKHIVRLIENTSILCLPATQTEPYLAMCLIASLFRASYMRRAHLISALYTKWLDFFLSKIGPEVGHPADFHSL